MKSSNKKPAITFHFLTLFPEAIQPILESSLLGKAQAKGLVRYSFTQIRDFSTDKHRRVDDAPYGGGEGMLLRADVLHQALMSVVGSKKKTAKRKVVLLSPQGQVFNQKIAKQLSKCSELILVCGHYEGVDERFIEHDVDLELSIGDYVLTGGELPATVIADTVTRLVPEVVGNSDSISEESFEGGLLKYPQYTRPRLFEGKDIPEVLLSGDHAKIKKWRDEQRLSRTKERRPDLLKKKR